METADIIRAIECVYQELREGNVIAAGQSLENLLDDLNGQNPKVQDLSLFRQMGLIEQAAALKQRAEAELQRESGTLQAMASIVRRMHKEEL